MVVGRLLHTLGKKLGLKNYTEAISFPLDVLTDFFMTTDVKQIYSDGSGRNLESSHILFHCFTDDGRAGGKQSVNQG